MLAALCLSNGLWFCMVPLTPEHYQRVTVTGNLPQYLKK